MFVLLTLATVALRGGSGRQSVCVVEPNCDNAPRRADRICALAPANATVREPLASKDCFARASQS